MSDAGNWIPKDLDIRVPNAGRVYDYWLGGAHNFLADRRFGAKIAEMIPVKRFARENRDFLARVVRFLVCEKGVRQFLDLGSGILTVGNVHEIAQAMSSHCRIVYVDIDPVATAHSERLLSDNELATVVNADLCDPAAVLNHDRTGRWLDFSKPVAVLMCAVLHFVPDEANPRGIIAAYRAALRHGSYLAISHTTADDYPTELAPAIEMYQQTTTPATLRTREEITMLFDGFRLVEPGLVFTPEWRPERPHTIRDPRESLCYGGLATL